MRFLLVLLLCWPDKGPLSPGGPAAAADHTPEGLLLLFTDHALFAQLDQRLQTRVNAPSKGPVVIAPTEPWESYGISAYNHVLRVSPTEDRMYYDCVEGSLRGPGRRICMAASR